MQIKLRDDESDHLHATPTNRTRIKGFRRTVEFEAFFYDAPDGNGQFFCMELLIDGTNIATYRQSVTIEKEAKLLPRLAESRVQGELRIATKYLSKVLMNYFLDETEKLAPAVRLESVRPPLGRPTGWNKDNLTHAVRTALKALPSPKDRTLQKVAEKIKVTHDKKAPGTGDALRKLIDRIGLDWKSLKKESKTGVTE